MYAIWINAAVILVGGLIGTALRGGIPARFQKVINQSLALCVLLIGIAGAMKTENVMVVILSMVIGAFIGEAVRIEDRLNHLGDFAQRKLKGQTGFSEGFVSATLLFCVGAMAVVGSLEAGLNGNSATLLAKSALDGVSSIIFASTFGAGVILSAVPVLLYQGGIALLAGVIGQFLSAQVIAEMSAVGSVLIIGLSLNMLGATKEKIRVSNMLPAMLIPALYFPLSEWVMHLFS